MALVEEAYIGQPRDVEFAERQISSFFVDGLLHDKLKMKIIRDNPAMTEQDLISRYGIKHSFGYRRSIRRESSTYGS